MARGFITRTESFSAGHRLHSIHLTDEENREVYGKCNHVHGHGHNYRVQVTVEGEIATQTGMIMNLTDLKAMMKTVLDQLDHRHLDLDVSFFKTNPSTAENVSVFIWNELKPLIAEHDSSLSLHEVCVHETDNNVAFYRGG